MQITTDILSDPRTVFAAASVTGATGTATAWSWIPADIGHIASLVGIIVTLGMFIMYIRKHRLEVKLIKKKLNGEL